MSSGEDSYYVMHYSENSKGCPSSLIGFFNCEEFEWEPFELNPLRINIKNNYVLKLSELDMDLNDLSFDFFQGGSVYVSSKFLEVCDRVGAIYRAIPLSISFRHEQREGEFFIFLPGEQLPALDKTLSTYQISKDSETGREIESPLYPGTVSIDSVENFVVAAGIKSNIFRCQETLELFCSESFKLAASDLKGLSFSKVDESYKYDPWAEFDSI